MKTIKVTTNELATIIDALADRASWFDTGAKKSPTTHGAAAWRTRANEVRNLAERLVDEHGYGK